MIKRKVNVPLGSIQSTLTPRRATKSRTTTTTTTPTLNNWIHLRDIISGLVMQAANTSIAMANCKCNCKSVTVNNTHENACWLAVCWVKIRPIDQQNGPHWIQMCSPFFGLVSCCFSISIGHSGWFHRCKWCNQFSQNSTMRAKSVKRNNEHDEDDEDDDEDNLHIDWYGHFWPETKLQSSFISVCFSLPLNWPPNESAGEVLIVIVVVVVAVIVLVVATEEPRLDKSRASWQQTKCRPYF